MPRALSVSTSGHRSRLVCRDLFHGDLQKSSEPLFAPREDKLLGFGTNALEESGLGEIEREALLLVGNHSVLRCLADGVDVDAANLLGGKQDLLHRLVLRVVQFRLLGDPPHRDGKKREHDSEKEVRQVGVFEDLVHLLNVSRGNGDREKSGEQTTDRNRVTRLIMW